MTIAEAAARLRSATGSSITGEEFRSLAKSLYGSSDEPHVNVLLRDTHYLRVGTSSAFDEAFLHRFQRDYSGPMNLSGVDLGQGPGVATVTDGGSKFYLAPAGAVAVLCNWLAEQLNPAPVPAAA